MKNKFQSGICVLILILLVVVACIPLSRLMREREQQIKIWGINPGHVDFVTNDGGTGSMLVKDLDNAEQEIMDHFQYLIDEELAEFTDDFKIVRLNGKKL